MPMDAHKGIMGVAEYERKMAQSISAAPAVEVKPEILENEPVKKEPKVEGKGEPENFENMSCNRSPAASCPPF